ncbi:MAG: carboxypeptidase regulatory-like domain-containing protein [Deltaproteobacteria bacterium]|nr:carboxypeptidase regulatory-like domain-containing protein [Deltaproteobacteria bacterium]
MAPRRQPRRCMVLPALLLVLGCADPFADDGSTGCADTDHDVSTIEVSGDAFAFTLPGTPYGLIAGATISIVEQPGITTTTDEAGHFVLPEVPAGSLATFEMVADGFPRARTKTFTLPDDGPLERVTFQIPGDDLFALLADLLSVEVDPGACQIVSTVTRVGKSIYDDGAHGEAGATVTLEPSIDPARGPVYFGADVVPDPMLTETTEDGGVLFSNVPAGSYVLRAMKDGVSFESVTLNCEGGTLVNASPPYGLQAL